MLLNYLLVIACFVVCSYISETSSDLNLGLQISQEVLDKIPKERRAQIGMLLTAIVSYF